MNKWKSSLPTKHTRHPKAELAEDDERKSLNRNLDRVVFATCKYDCDQNRITT